jgi:hypothetical protein
MASPEGRDASRSHALRGDDTASPPSVVRRTPLGKRPPVGFTECRRERFVLVFISPFCQGSSLVSLGRNPFLLKSDLREELMSKLASIHTAQQHLTVLVKTIRGQKVILDADLARVYGVPTRRLNEQVRRNADRFPPDFVFQLTSEEFKILISQNATSSSGYGGRRKLPLAFTEHGAIMAANVLKSKRAIQMSIIVVTTFIELRRALLGDSELAAWLRELERKVSNHDKDIRILFSAIKSLIAPPERPRRKVGFEVR